MKKRLHAIIDFVVTNRNRIFIVSCLLVHIALLAFFLILGVKPAAGLNCFSVLFYTILLFMSSKPSHRYIVACYFEIIAFATIMSFMLSTRAGFHYYIFGMVAIIFLMAPESGAYRYLYQLIGFISFGICDIHSDTYNIFPESKGIVEPYLISLYNANYICVIVFLIATSFMFATNITTSMNVLSELSLKDPLTKLANRRALNNFIGGITSNGVSYSLAIVDIDDFKKVNDTYGHDVGDEVLKSLARKLEDSVRQTDMIARWGGEEFIVCLPTCPLENAVIILNKILQETSQMNIEGYDHLRITFTSGVVISSSTNVESVVKQADALLYKGKTNGKNQIVC